MPNDNNNINTKKQIFYSIVWIGLILPVRGLLNPMWFLNPLFSQKFDNNIKLISNTFFHGLLKN
jgi:hypothetical protein